MFPSLTWQASVLGERELPTLSLKDISILVKNPDPTKNLDVSNPNSHLSNILIPRAPDTENNTLVRNYIISTLKSLDWHIEEDQFTDNTPVGRRRFTNVIATKDPDAPRRVILSAHFDSKYFSSYPQNQFLGATDSAAPCAIMLDLAEALNPLLEARMKRLEEGIEEDEDVADVTLQLVFFDGEEAFGEWTDTDSIYGARHLAEKWRTTYIAPNSKRRLNYAATEIQTIEHLILLDLLGAPNPLIRSYFMDTAWLYDAMASAERRLGESGSFVFEDKQDMTPETWKSYFRPRRGKARNLGYIGDDHVPFMHNGVSILHVIGDPFPSVWHTLRDDASALDLPTMRRWNLILRVFIAEYLHLQPQDMKPRTGPVQRSTSELG